MAPEFPRAFGRYTLDGLLALGGMAEVYRAHLAGPAGFEQDVVIKRILPEYHREPDFVSMFLDEARLVAQLAHPHIVQLRDFGEADGSYFMVMELVCGSSLRAVIKASLAMGRDIPAGVVAFVGAGVASGLDYAHGLADKQGQPLHIVHRDICPSNILLTYQGMPKILDFGIAKAAVQSHLTRTGVVRGKLAFMAPEQVMLRPLDGRTDIYSLGVVLYDLLTGQPPFQAPSELETMNRITRGDFAPLRPLRPDIPDLLAQIVAKAMAVNPEDRYSRARDMAMDLDRVCQQDGHVTDSYAVAAFLDALEKAHGRPLTALDAPSSAVLSPNSPTRETETLCAAPETGAQSPASRWTLILLAALVVLVALFSVQSFLLRPTQTPSVGSATLHTSSEKNASPGPAPSTQNISAQEAAPAEHAHAPVPRTIAHGRVAATPGSMVLLVNPWADVWIDGRRYGTTPLPPVTLSAGRHEILAVHPDTGRRAERSVTIGAGQSVTIKIDLSRDDQSLPVH